MKASELRIGNFVSHPSNHKFIVGSINPYFIREQVWEDGAIYKLEECSPIPLTEQWLLKFGFENSKTQDKFFTKDDGIGISTADGKLRFIKGNFVCQLVLTEVKYVHSLQNLYFALTGEELKTT